MSGFSRLFWPGPVLALVIFLTWAGLAPHSALAQARILPQIGPDAVWKADWQLLARHHGEVLAGLEAFMRSQGASYQALAFTRSVKGEGFLCSFTEMGQVDLAQMQVPFKNDEPDYLLVNGTPQIVAVGQKQYWQPLDLRKTPWVGQHPKADWFARINFLRLVSRPGGGQRFIFAFAIQDGCRACAILGNALVAYDFDPAGTFLSTRLLGFSK